jgi:hypothetical protein
MSNNKKFGLGLRIVFMPLLLLLCIVFFASLGIMIFGVICGEDSRLNDVPFMIFESIEECKKIEELSYTNVTVEVYDSVDIDMYIDEFEYTDYYIADFHSEELVFSIWAYEFRDEKTALKYYCAAAGQYEYSAPLAYIRSHITTKMYVRNENKVYRTQCYHNFYYELRTSLASIFSFELFKENDHALVFNLFQTDITLGKIVDKKGYL